MRFAGLVTLLLFDAYLTVAVAECEKGLLPSESENSTLSLRNEMYRNVSTAPSLISIQVHDARSNTVHKIVVENDSVAGFIASERKIPKERLEAFYACDYVEMMLHKHETPLTLDIERFIEYLARTTFGSTSAAQKYVRGQVFDVPMTFGELDVKNEEELIEKYFFFDRSQKIGSARPGISVVYQARFIALLIELGYVVSRGDIVPVLMMRK